MKSQHRHELQTNVLSAGLARWIDVVRPFTGQIVTGGVMLVIVYAGLSIWDAQAAEKEREAWDAFADAAYTVDPALESLLDVAQDEKYAGTKMQEWAYVSWADRQVLNAMNLYLVDRELSQSHLKDAVGVYEPLANGASDSQVLNRARFGLARIYELQNKIDEAREQYQRVQGNLQLQATDRASQLQSKTVREDCEWLATAELPKRDLTGGQGASGERPAFEAVVPELDAITVEKLDELLGDAADSTETEQEKDAEPVESDADKE